MREETKNLILKLAEKIAKLQGPIHLLAVCSGGLTLTKTIAAHLKRRGIEVDYFEVWTNVIKGKREIWKTSFRKENYKGTAVIVEDVIWRGSSLPPIKKMLKEITPQKKIYIAALLDCGGKADFSIFN